MPLYEYRCEGCGERFEVIQKFSDEPLTTHDKCGGSVHRLLSAPALQFKGSGWYVNDYAKSSKPESSKPEGDGAPKKDDSAPAKASPSESSGASSSGATNATPPGNTKKTTTSSDTKNE
jgi:putative FmdB family regulatory protein